MHKKKEIIEAQASVKSTLKIPLDRTSNTFKCHDVLQFAAIPISRADLSGANNACRYPHSAKSSKLHAVVSSPCCFAPLRS